MPVFVPILISSQSVAGEKERRTLEPLLAAPISAAELVLGKSLASVVPAVAITWLSFGVFVAAVDLVAWPLVHGPVLPNATWLFGVGVVAPLFAFLGNGLAVLVSARVGEARLAQQVSALVVLPLMGLVSGQLAGWIRAGTGYYAILGAVVLVLDVLLVRASVRLFDRERLVSRWV
jgi:ABC-type Na+ efflux pump permease subunit